ncbi:hypothetical protein LguiA_005539 [Lonicera macranthoides]
MEAIKGMANLQPPSNPHQSPFPKNHNSPTAAPTVAFTTPNNYAGRLSQFLRLKGWTPLWCPTVVVQTTPHTHSSLIRYLSNPRNSKSTPLEQFSAIAFTSRTGISAFSETLASIESPPLSPCGNAFTISGLGKDSELIDESFIGRICENRDRIRVLVPPVATPAGLVEAIGPGHGQRVLCPVPVVVGLEEPPVVPEFLRDLRLKGWVAVRVDGYETRWAGRGCAEEVAMRSEKGGGVDAIMFTSTAEVEGLLKSLRWFGLDWVVVRERFPAMVVAAHGPVTAAGAERLGVEVDVVSSKFGSFEGVVDALALRWQTF